LQPTALSSLWPPVSRQTPTVPQRWRVSFSIFFPRVEPPTDAPEPHRFPLLFFFFSSGDDDGYSLPSCQRILWLSAFLQLCAADCPPGSRSPRTIVTLGRLLPRLVCTPDFYPRIACFHPTGFLFPSFRRHSPGPIFNFCSARIDHPRVHSFLWLRPRRLFSFLLFVQSTGPG